MELAQAYREIETRLDRLDFPALFRGFSRFPFALYDENRAFIDGRYIEKPESFMGNTSVKLNGADTAIWKLAGEDWDFDVLSAKLAHEMLHAFQNASGEKRWADERAALVRYRYDEGNIAARLEEAACMKACLEGAAPDAFARLLSLRKARSLRFPFACDYEARIEQIEGTAHFVELMALEQLDGGKAKRRWAELLSALSDPARYFPARPVTYLSGAAFLACLKKYTSFDTDAFSDVPFSAAAAAGARPCALPSGNPRAAACLEEWNGKLRDAAARAVEKGEIVLEGAYRMIVWNVYDAAWDGRYAVLTAFLGYIEDGALPETDEELFARMKILNGDFVAEMDENMRFIRVWRR